VTTDAEDPTCLLYDIVSIKLCVYVLLQVWRASVLFSRSWESFTERMVAYSLSFPFSTGS